MDRLLVLCLFMLTGLAAPQDLAPDTQPVEDTSPPRSVPQQSNLVAVRIFSKANPALSLTGFWNGKVVLSWGNGTMPFQQWIVDPSLGLKFADAVGSKAFILVNKATGMVLRHSYLDNTPVTCSTMFKAEIPDVLWTKGPDVPLGFHTIRACNKIELNLDVEHLLEKKHLPVKDGSKVIMAKCNEQESQYWRIEPVYM